MEKYYGTIKDIIPSLLKYDMDKKYLVEIKEPKDKRTLNQNKYMWAIINEISKKQHEDSIDIYCHALEEARAVYSDVIGEPEIEEELRKGFRAVKIIRPLFQKGKKYYVYRCFTGSSKFNKKEMTDLLEIILKWAYELDINTEIIDY